MTKCLCIVCYFNMQVSFIVFESDAYCVMLKTSYLFTKPGMPEETFKMKALYPGDSVQTALN